MTTEEDFQKALDANPHDHQTRMVFADWLEERGDPRAEGYRALGMLRRYPSYWKGSHGYGRPLENPNWSWGTRANPHTQEGNLYFHNPEILHNDWMCAIPHQVTTTGYGEHDEEFWRHHHNRREADDAAALAFGTLPEATKAEILGASKLSRYHSELYVVRRQSIADLRKKS